MSKSSAHNLLATLEDSRFVERDPASRRFRLGPELVRLGRAADRHTDLVAKAARAAERLAHKHAFTFAVAQLVAPDVAEVVASVYPREDVHVGLTLGSRYGVFDGAIGKCLLASMPAAEAERRVQRAKLPRHTERTITDPSELLSEVSRVRRRGWGASLQELKENHAVAAPVAGASGRTDAVLFAVAFTGQMPARDVPDVGAILRKAADEVTVACGGTPAAVEDRWQASHL